MIRAGESGDLECAELKALSKAQLVERVIELRQALAEKEAQLSELTQQLAKLHRQQDEQKQTEVNKTVNQPSSKKPEWDKDGNPRRGKPGKRKGKRAKRPGCGNRPKNREPDETNVTPLDECPDCAKDLSGQPGTTTGGRQVEDIDPPAEKTTVSKEVEEMKWCSRCQKMVRS